MAHKLHAQPGRVPGIPRLFKREDAEQQIHILGHAMNGQRPMRDIVIALLFHRLALEGDLREFFRVKIVRRTQIVVARRDERPVVVVSAMSRMTDALLAAVNAALAGDAQAAMRALNEHFARHTSVAAWNGWK